MPREISITEARTKLAALVHSVEKSPAIRLTRRGKPLAVLVSLEEYERLSPRRPDLWRAIEEFRKRTDLSEIDVDEVFQGIRDRSPSRERKLPWSGAS